MGRDPNVFPPFRNPNPVYLPMSGRLGYYRRRMMNGSSIMTMVRGDDGRRITILEQIVKGHRSKPDGNSFPAPPNSIIGKGIGYRIKKHPEHQQPNNNPPFHDRLTS
jgi:hypothetical protein